MDLIANTHVVDTVPNPLFCGNEMIIGQLMRKETGCLWGRKIHRTTVHPEGDLLEIIPVRSVFCPK